MKKTILSLCALVMLSAGTVANASILFEPYLGYYTGTTDLPGSDQDMKGMTYGARVGFQQLGVMAGLDFMGGNWTVSTTPSADFVPTEAYFFVGYDFPVLVRVYGAYGFSTSLKSETTSNKYEGTSMKAGIGFTTLPLVSVNLEYSTATYTKYDGATLATDAKRDMYGLSVSLPLNF